MKYGLVILIGLLMNASAALAKGPPQQVIISGGGVEITLTDHWTPLDALGTMILEDYPTLTSNAPAGIDGDGYLITRYFATEDGELTAYDQVRYYPNPENGRGYLHYVGIFNGSSEYDDLWFRPKAEGEASLQWLIGGAEQAKAVVSAGLRDVWGLTMRVLT